jgi:hypothetical protein
VRLALAHVVTRRHEVLLMLPEMMQEQAAMHEWEAMAHNVSGRLAKGACLNLLLFKLNILTVVFKHPQTLLNLLRGILKVGWC